MPANSELHRIAPAGNFDSNLVAILMGTKNGAGFLKEQLESIADQTHKNWMLIVSDDGSTDDTKAILADFAAKHTQKLTVRDGARAGVCANFLSLATDPASSDLALSSCLSGLQNFNMRCLSLFNEIPLCSTTEFSV